MNDGGAKQTREHLFCELCKKTIWHGALLMPSMIVPVNRFWLCHFQTCVSCLRAQQGGTGLVGVTSLK